MSDFTYIIFWKSKTKATVIIVKVTMRQAKRIPSKRYKGILWDDGNVQYLDCGGSYIFIYIYQNSWSCIPKKVNLTLCKLFLSEPDV